MPLRQLTYFHGFFPSLGDANPAGADTVLHLPAAAFPPWIADAFDYEDISWAQGELGFPDAAVDKVEVDDLRFETDEHAGHVRAVNRALALMQDENPALTRLHRFFSSLAHFVASIRETSTSMPDRPDIHMPDELNWSRVGLTYTERKGIVARLLDAAADDHIAITMPIGGREVPIDLREYVSAVGGAYEDPVTSFTLFNGWQQNSSAVERLAEQSPYPDDCEEAHVLARLISPAASVFEVRETVPGHGLRIRHLLRYGGLDESWIVDDEASLRFREGAFGFARLLRFDEFTMLAGMPAPLDGAAVDQVLEDVSDFAKVTTSELTSRALDQFIGIASGAAYLGRYSADRRHSSGDGAPAVPQKRSSGRNDPCPCGSGRKYKHCCWA